MQEYNTKNITQKYKTRTTHKEIHHEDITQKYTTRKIQHIYVQREAEVAPPDISMMKKERQQNSVEIRPIPFQNDDPMNL